MNWHDHEGPYGIKPGRREPSRIWTVVIGCLLFVGYILAATAEAWGR